jgi:hypothetical protein
MAFPLASIYVPTSKLSALCVSFAARKLAADRLIREGLQALAMVPSLLVGGKHRTLAILPG